MLAEFKYGGVPAETFGHVVNQGLPRWIFFKMKTDFFPRVYWGPYMSGHWSVPAILFLEETASNIKDSLTGTEAKASSGPSSMTRFR